MQTYEEIMQAETPPEAISRPFSKEEIRKCRHKAENSLWLVCFLISMTAAVLAVVLVLIKQPVLGDGIDFFLNNVFFMAAQEEGEPEENDSEDNFIDVVYENSFYYIWLIIFTPIVLFFGLHSLFAYTRAFSVRVTPVNFPEIYRKSEEYTYKLGLKKLPPVYIRQQNGRLNAF
ncbi:MAG: hypothetical protein FWE60_05055, partial [Oscillospiraceae bacterium]|nr:hypothetical protein [Oscillospiraceae bacterium]